MFGGRHFIGCQEIASLISCRVVEKQFTNIIALLLFNHNNYNHKITSKSLKKKVVYFLCHSIEITPLSKSTFRKKTDFFLKNHFIPKKGDFPTTGGLFKVSKNNLTSI